MTKLAFEACNLYNITF
jgi:hypothetical protein